MIPVQPCRWCSPDKAGAETGGEAPLCACCMEHFSLPPDGPIQKYLDELVFPVLGVELHAGKRMITRVVNKCACTWLNKEPREIIQHLLGNVLACVHARLAEGCGGAIACETCDVLRSIAGTVHTGESLNAVPAMLLREEPGGPVAVSLRITTLIAGGLVMVRLDRR